MGRQKKKREQAQSFFLCVNFGGEESNIPCWHRTELFFWGEEKKSIKKQTQTI